MITAWQVLLLVILAPLAQLWLGEPAYAQAASMPVEEINAAVQAELQDDANDIPDTAIMLVYSNTGWTGSIIASDLASSPSAGAGDGKIQFSCEGEAGRYSASFQKQTDEGYLTIAAIQSGNLLNSTSTVSPLGIANIGGFCQDAEEQTTTVRDSACMIATAAFGSELAPQVQYLRDFRDQRILSTVAGSSFMNAFNSIYYSFSPHVADYEREQPWLQQAVRTAVYPLLGILTMSEKVYSASEGELGAIAAGFVASSLIGALYLAPAAFSVKQIRERRINYRTLATVAAGVSAALVLSIYAGSMEIMMITTSAFVLSVSLISAVMVALTAARIMRKR